MAVANLLRPHQPNDYSHSKTPCASGTSVQLARWVHGLLLNSAMEVAVALGGEQYLLRDPLRHETPANARS